MSGDEKPDGWQGMTSVTGGDTRASGLVEPVTGLQQRPCLACASWEQDMTRLRKHILSKRNVEILPDGTVRSRIDRDLPGRQSKTFNLRDFGWCRFSLMPTDNQATCEHWTPTRSVSDLMRKIRRGR